MIGQNHHRVDREGMPSPHLAKRGPQLIDVSRQQPQSPLHQINGEEEAPSGHEVATICGHAGMFTKAT
jgi:hypothetical protein